MKASIMLVDYFQFYEVLTGQEIYISPGENWFITDILWEKI